MSTDLVNLSTALQAAVFLLLLWKLSRADLASKYRAFTAFIIFELLRILVAAFIPRRSNVYGWFYLLTQPAIWVFYALVTLEVFNSVFRTLPGISRFSRYVIVSATGVAIVVSTLSLVLGVGDGSPFQTLELYFTLERAIFLSLLTFVMMLVVFLYWYPVPVHTNAVVYSGVFALYFAVKTATFLVRTLGGQEFAVPVSIAAIVGSVTSCVMWMVLLSAAGETRRARSVRGLSEDRERQLLAQLKSFDSALRSGPERPTNKVWLE